MAEKLGKLKDGHQVTKESLAIAISNHRGCDINEIVLEDFKLKGGSRVYEY